MRRLLGAALLTIPLAVSAAVPAQGDPSAGAIIVKGANGGGTCTISAVWPPGETTDFINLLTPSGDVLLICRFSGLTSAGRVTQRIHIPLCSTYLGLTEGTFVWTPSGHGTLKCLIKKP